MEFYNNQDQVGGPAYILLGYWIALINGEKAMGETLFGKWVMLGWVHKLKVVYCLFGCLYTIITDFGNINESSKTLEKETEKCYTDKCFNTFINN